MKIVHVMTSTRGGAGIAAMRLHDAIGASGLDSHVLCLVPPAFPRDDVTTLPRRLARFWERAAVRAGMPRTEDERVRRRRDELGLHGVSFSWPASDYDISSHPLVESADVVHLHWVSGLLDWKTFFARVSTPVVWTLHDMNPFLGGFHYSGDAARATDAVKHEDASLLKLKASHIAPARRLHVVTPSHWLGRLSSSSPALARFPHSVIRYAIDGSASLAFSRAAAREVFGIREQSRVILSVAERAADHRKGFDILRDALERPGMTERFEWIVAGNPAGLAATRARALGTLSDPRLMSLAYAAADVVVVPSREDNLPNVVIESLVAGTPVVGLPAGGIPEMIREGVNGTLAESGDAHSLAEAIARADELRLDRSTIRKEALAAYDPRSVAAEYTRVYESLR